MQASALLLRWGSYHWARNLLVLIIYSFFLPVAVCASNAHHRLRSESVSWCLETSLFLRFPSWDVTPFPAWDSLSGAEPPPYLLCLLFHLLYFFLPVSENNDLLFWVPNVLCQHSEVVLWNLLSIEMFF